MKKLLFFFMSFFTILGYAQFPEGFEGNTFPPTGWAAFDNGVGSNQWIRTTSFFHTGVACARINGQNVTNGTTSVDWLVTPQVTVPANGQVRFYGRKTQTVDLGSTYTIRVSTTSQTNPATFTTVQTWTETDFDPTNWQQKFVPLTAYIGQNVFIAFVMENDNGDRWLVDDIKVDSQCLTPTGLSAVSLSTSATVSWTSPNPAGPWQIDYGPAGFTQGTTGPGINIVNATSNSTVINGLNPLTNYDFYVRTLCDVDNPSPWSIKRNFTTTSLPPVCGGIFIDEGGPTGNYPANENRTVTIVPSVPGEVVTVTFTSFSTEVNSDALYVYDGPSTASPLLSSGNPAGFVPGGLAGGYWGTAIPGPFASSHASGALTFVFRSDGSQNRAGWTSNVSCSTCPPPTFTQVPAICSGGSLAALPTTSTNGITGTWSPALNTSATTTYTFTPSNSLCSTTASMTITVNPTPLAPVGNAIQLFCVGETPTIAELRATGTNVQWYANQLDAINAINPLPNTTLLTNDATYYASQTANGCESSDFLSVQVKFNDLQITASETTVCSGTQVSLTASTTALINNSGLPTNLQNGLVGYWPFNGNANDSSGNGNNGTVNGAILTSDRFGTTNKAYTFDGNDYIEIQDSPSLNFSDQFSLSFYVKNEEPVGGWYMCVNKDNWGESGIVTFIAENKFFYSKPEHAGWIISTDLSANSWDLITITNNNGLSTLYKNGQFIMSDTIPIINNSESLVFGGSHNGGVIGSFKGILDDIIIWNRALSLSEIQQLYTPAPSYLWSTGETTSIINPSPTETTTYWCDVTVNGSTCRKEMTITVNPLTTYYADADGDGFGSGAPVLLCSSTPPTGYATNNSDCNDGLATLTTSCVVTLPLKALIQGYYKGSGQMTPVRKNAGLSSSNDEVDEVTVALYSPSNINQAVATSTVVLTVNGTATAQFDATLLTESNYYLSLQHKNTIKTWSATPVAITNGTTYDFTTAASHAYGNNQIEVAPGIYALYSGDMNQDGTINEADLPILTTANTTAAHGYIVSDLNGDGSVDLLDYPIYKNNTDISVVEKRPLVVASLPNVTIGTQVWQSSNLDVATYRDGTPIPQVTDPTAWANLTTGAWCYYNNDPANGAIYGKLYNWYAVAGIHDNDPNTPNKILAPEGWHVPTDAEWSTLVAFLGGGSVAGGKMKASNETLWASPNIGATNTSGFFGLPGGWRNELTQYGNITGYAMWWSFSEHDNSYALNRFLDYTNVQVFRDLYKKSVGFSVRCLRD